ncbi:MAG: hypothetical protein ABSF61_09750 [Anaerolineales bacterium]
MATGWTLVPGSPGTGCRAEPQMRVPGVPGRSQRDVFAARETLRQHLPFPLLGLDAHNDSVFLKAHLLRSPRHEPIPFTRCRP